jgi:hypothetical protein
VRLRTVHANQLPECPIKTPLDVCYYKTPSELEPDSINKATIQDVAFSSCEENGIDYAIDGEQGPFPCFGYKMDIAHGLTPAQF